jgi:hypothetical protein
MLRLGPLVAETLGTQPQALREEFETAMREGHVLIRIVAVHPPIAGDDRGPWLELALGLPVSRPILYARRARRGSARSVAKSTRSMTGSAHSSTTPSERHAPPEHVSKACQVGVGAPALRGANLVLGLWRGVLGDAVVCTLIFGRPDSQTRGERASVETLV